MPQISIVKVTEQLQFDRGDKKYLVQYMVDDHGPFTCTATRAEIDAGLPTADMRAFASALGRAPRS